LRLVLPVSPESGRSRRSWREYSRARTTMVRKSKEKYFSYITLWNIVTQSVSHARSDFFLTILLQRLKNVPAGEQLNVFCFQTCFCHYDVNCMSSFCNTLIYYLAMKTCKILKFCLEPTVFTQSFAKVYIWKCMFFFLSETTCC
jgi:hypothetical protein